MGELRLGIFGGGPRGEDHMENFSKIKGVHLEAICDPIENVRTKLVKRFEIANQFENIEQMINASSLDAVIICVPAQLNFDTALICMESGLDTLLEKPPGMRLEETQKLREVADSAGGCYVWLALIVDSIH